MQGASQSMEDGVTIASCLRQAGKDNIAFGLKVYERMRYVVFPPRSCALSISCSVIFPSSPALPVLIPT